MRKSTLIGIAGALVLVAGMTTWARQRDAPPEAAASPAVTDDFIEVGDRLILRRSRIESFTFRLDGGFGHVFLIGRQQSIEVTAEEAKELRVALTAPPGGPEPDPALTPLPNTAFPGGPEPE